MAKNDYDTDESGNKYYRNEKGQFHREKDEPAVVYADGTNMWFHKGKLHRDNDKPAVEHSNGDKEWWVNGERHRDEGPAVVKATGEEEYYFEGLHRPKSEEVEEVVINSDDVATIKAEDFEE
tara:strand:+ start:761 stop:1126 length:366 start_codon:yes stop_codon:yes gene_type:complete